MTENPLREGLRQEPRPEPCTVVIFGASGDLAHRKLVPALYQLARGDRLPPSYAVVGFARTPMSDEEFRERLREAMKVPAAEPTWESFAGHLRYVAGQYDDVASFRRLGALPRFPSCRDNQQR